MYVQEQTRFLKSPWNWWHWEKELNHPMIRSRWFEPMNCIVLRLKTKVHVQLSAFLKRTYSKKKRTYSIYTADSGIMQHTCYNNQVSNLTWLEHPAGVHGVVWMWFPLWTLISISFSLVSDAMKDVLIILWPNLKTSMFLYLVMFFFQWTVYV